MLKEKSTAPDFTLPDQNGTQHSLSQYRGSWVLLYFYPKDMTPGCTTEACSLRDVYGDYKKAGVKVLGVSKDSVKRHEKFAKMYELPFPILSDETGAMIEAYEAWGKKKFMGREFMGILRISYLIDPKGKIAKVYEKVKPSEHAQEVLGDVKNALL